MDVTFPAFIEQSRRVLQAVCGDAEPRELERLLAVRGELLRAFTESGETLSAAQVEEVVAVEVEIRQAMTARRDSLAQELVQLRRSRNATRLYEAPAERAARYLDREG